MMVKCHAKGTFDEARTYHMTERIYYKSDAPPNAKCHACLTDHRCSTVSEYIVCTYIV